MLDMFKRKSDPAEYNYLYAIPGATLIGTLLAGTALGFPNLAYMAYLASGLCCLGGIAGLST